MSIAEGEFTFADLIKDDSKNNDNNDITEGEFTFADLIKDDAKVSNRNDEIVEGEFSFADLMHNNGKNNNDNNYDDDNDGYDPNEFNITGDCSDELIILKELPTDINELTTNERNYLSKVADIKPINNINKKDKKDEKDSYSKTSEFKSSGDDELDELEMEHHALQEMRRSLIDRIKYAKEKCRISDEVIENGQQQFDFITNNLINTGLNPVISPPQPPIQSNKTVSRPQLRGASTSLNPTKKKVLVTNNIKPLSRPFSAQPKIVCLIVVIYFVISQYYLLFI
jgi:hypothetical protein